MWKSVALRVAIVGITVGVLLWGVEFTGQGIMGVHDDSGQKLGKRLFEQNCARCHSLDPAKPTSIGPFLGDLYTRADNNQSGLTGVEYVANSIIRPSDFIVPGYTNTMPQLPASITEEGVKALVSFLLKGTASQSDLNNIKLPLNNGVDKTALQSSRDEIEQGQALFYGNGQCAKCHSGHPGMEYGVYGPTLAWRGLTDPKYIAEAIISPNANVSANYGTVSCLLSTGEAFSGRISAQSADAIELVVEASNGKLYNKRIVKSDLDDPATASSESDIRSPMPDNFKQVLSEEQIQSLVAFIHALNAK